MEVEPADQIIARQNDEITRLRQELQRYQAQGGQGGSAAHPDGVPLPPEPTLENFRMKEAILRSVPKYYDDGKIL